MVTPARLPFTGVWVVWAVVMVGGPRPSEGFNLSPAHSKLWRGSHDTHFGFSVALWSDQRGSKRVVVGAPLGKNSTAGRGELPLGNIHLCDISGDDICLAKTELPIVSEADKSEAALDDGFTMARYGMGFGHTLSTLKKANSVLTACAPRYPRREERTIENRGACFVLATPSEGAISLVPYGRKVPRKDTVQHAMLGFSAALDDTGDNVVLGGPNAFSGEGMLLNQSFQRGPRPTNRLAVGMQVPKSVDFGSTYEGWSIVLGNFGNQSTMIAASTVNYGNYTGRVSFYPPTMTQQAPPLKSVYGEDVGAKFGYSLASGDIDGDGAADLLVGAPLAPRGSGTGPDAGKVFVYFSPLLAGREGRPRQQLEGPQPWARFGTALTALADLNLDGYDDVAIAAPYGGMDLTGVVYVYNGGATGLSTEPTQVIQASFYSGGIHSFGFSLDGGMDMDHNGYPDLIIGAPESDTAVLIRSSPVVRLVGGVSLQPGAVMVEDSGCQIEEAGYRTFRGVCFILTVNITYHSFRRIPDLKMRFDMVLEGPEDTSLFGFTINNDPRYKRIVRVNRAGKNSPWSIQAYAKRARSNIGQTIRASVTISLVPPDEGEEEEEEKEEEEAALPVVPPVMDALGSTSFTTNTTLLCRNNKTCFSQPDLAVGGTGHPLKLGQNPVVVEVWLEVLQDPGYTVEVEVRHPGVVRYHRVLGLGRIPACGPKLLVNQIPTTVLCSFDFIEADESVNFTLQFRYEPLTLLRHLGKDNSTTLPLDLAIRSDSDGDTNLSNNKANVDVPVNKQAVLYTKVDAEPEFATVMVNKTASSKDLENVQTDQGSHSFPVDRLGPRLQQKFSLTNRGPTPVISAKLVFYLPLYHDQDRLIYFIDQPQTTGPVRCPLLPVNPLGLQPARRAEIDAFRTSAVYHNSTTTPATSGATGVATTGTTDSPTYSTLEPEEDVIGRERRQAEGFSTTTMDMYDQDDDITAAPFSPHVHVSPEKVQAKDDLGRTLECFSPECRLTCTVGTLEAEEAVTVIFSSYLVIATVNKVPHRTMGVRAWVESEVEQDGSTVINPTSPATTHVSLIRPLETGFFAVPLWILLLAVVISVALILLIIAGLWKVGFFKRKRVQKGTKRESLIQPSQYACNTNDAAFPGGE